MSKRRAKKPPPDPAEEQQRLLLDQLKDLTEKAGVEVREEKILRGAGYTARSGPCRVNGQDVVILDRAVSVNERVEFLLDFLGGRDLDSLYIEPELRRMIGHDPAEVAEKTAVGDVD